MRLLEIKSVVPIILFYLHFSQAYPNPSISGGEDEIMQTSDQDHRYAFSDGHLAQVLSGLVRQPADEILNSVGSQSSPNPLSNPERLLCCIFQDSVKRNKGSKGKKQKHQQKQNQDQGNQNHAQQQQQYGPPPQNQQYGPPSQNQNYGPPAQNQQYGPYLQNQQHGPSSENQQYGPPSQNQQYGPPTHQPQQVYGPPQPQNQQYGPPSLPLMNMMPIGIPIPVPVPNNNNNKPPPPPPKMKSISWSFNFGGFGDRTKPRKRPPQPYQQFQQQNQQSYGPPNYNPPAPIQFQQQQYGPPQQNQPQQAYGPPPQQFQPQVQQFQPNYGPPQQQQQQPLTNYGPPPPPEPEQPYYGIQPDPQFSNNLVYPDLTTNSLSSGNNQQDYQNLNFPQNQQSFPNANPLGHDTSVFIYGPPEDDHQAPPVRKPIRVPHSQEKRYQVVVIKAPNPPRPDQIELELPAPPEQKTLVYVLMKRPGQGQDNIRFIKPPSTSPPPPEVFFIKYKNKQNQNGGSVSGNSDEGLREVSGYSTTKTAEGGYESRTRPSTSSAFAESLASDPEPSNENFEQQGYENELTMNMNTAYSEHQPRRSAARARSRSHYVAPGSEPWKR